MSIEVLKVSSSTNPKKTAGAISSILKRDPEVHVHTIGAAALNQAIKAIIIARGMLAISGLDLNIVPAFTQIMIDDKEKTGIKLVVQRVEK